MSNKYWWWFSLAREGGGPTYYPQQEMPCPAFVWYLNTVICVLIFLFPILAFVIILPSYRKKHWSSLMVVLLCFLTGFTLSVVFGSSSWLVGQAEVFMSVGPLRPPVNGTVGVWAGLWHVNLTYVTANLSLNEMVTWTTRVDLVTAHKAALKEGWPWALVGVTAELGGEGLAWRGNLGDGLRAAGFAASCLLVAAMYVWAVWVVLFTVAPGLTARPLMLTGVLMALCTLAYVICVGTHFPPQLMVGGTIMQLHLGFAWWLTTAMGIVLTTVGAALLLYEAKYPGHLTIFFEIDLGTASHRSFHPSWSSIEPVFAYKRVDETYSQLYPPSYVRDETMKTKINLNDGQNTQDNTELHHHKKDSLCDPSDNKNSKTKLCVKERNIPEINYNIESETKTLSETSIIPEKEREFIMSRTTLSFDQDHTPLRLEPSTLRRRSPEQPLEVLKEEQNSLLDPTTLQPLPPEPTRPPPLLPKPTKRPPPPPKPTERPPPPPKPTERPPPPPKPTKRQLPPPTILKSSPSISDRVTSDHNNVSRRSPLALTPSRPSVLARPFRTALTRTLPSPHPKVVRRISKKMIIKTPFRRRTPSVSNLLSDQETDSTSWQHSSERENEARTPF